MFRKNSMFFFLLVILFLIGCDSGTQQVIFGTIELKVNGIAASDFLPSEVITVSAELSSDLVSKNYTLYWKENNGEFVQSEELTKDYGPYESKSRHTITVKVVVGSNEIQKSLDLNIGTPVDFNGALSVSGTNIINENGKAIQLRGMSTHGIQYFDFFYDETAIKALAENWHADIIRISCYVNEGWGEHGNYLEEPDYWRSRVDSIVGWASNNGIYALIDWHQLVPGDPNTFLSQAKTFWEYMSKKHGDKPNVLFDICNEPNNDSTYDKDGNSISHKNPVTWSRIKEYADQIVPIIRQNSDNIIIVGTPQWASRPDLVSGNMIDEKNIMYTMHFYAADHSGYLNYVTAALNSGIPVFVTEFGTQEASGDGGNNFTAAQAWIDLMESNKISWCNWNFSSDDRSGAVFKELANLSSQSSYSDTSNLKEAGQWIFNKINVPGDDF